MKHKLLILALLLALAMPAQAEEFEVDASHSSVEFSVDHLMISTVAGRFDRFRGVVEFDLANKKLKSAQGILETNSINTNHPKRDRHLASPDFFDAEKYPEITFQSKKIEQDGDKITLTGDLKMNGVVKTLVLQGRYKGSVKDPQGKQRIGFVAKGELDRKDFGIVYNKPLETGGVVIGNLVEITLKIEAVAR